MGAAAFIPPSVMLPPRRLETLLRQALELQYSRCSLHNTRLGLSLDPHSLLIDHKCTRSGFPCETRQILSDHCDEVWCALFSHNGRYLATGSKETKVYIWEVDPITKRLKKWRTLEGHQYGAAFFAWSPDDRYLAVVGAEDGPDLWLWNIEKGELRVRMTHSPDDSLSAVAWHKNGTKFVCGGQKGSGWKCGGVVGRNPDSVSLVQGIILRNNHAPPQLKSLVKSFANKYKQMDGRTVLAADTHYRIRAYTFDDLTDYTMIREQDPLIYFCLDTSERYALCTTKGQGLHLWDMETNVLIKRFRGSKHGEYIVVSCFGGENEDFVATGSEDGKVFIWHRSREDPIRVLPGHTDVVNAVTWNPVDHSMLVSCSDDGTVRVWGPEGTGRELFEYDSGMYTAMDGCMSSSC